MNTVRTLAGFAFALLLSAATHPGLGEVKRVYLLSMSSGYDQYLANQITGQGLLEVVTDPKLADAVLTESIGRGFEDKLNELLPPPAPPPAPEPDAASKSRTSQEEADDLRLASTAMHTTSFSRGRGNLFLVDLKSRAVVWSSYKLPKNRTPKELDHTSRLVMDDLSRDLGKKK